VRKVTGSARKLATFLRMADAISHKQNESDKSRTVVRRTAGARNERLRLDKHRSPAPTMGKPKRNGIGPVQSRQCNPVKRAHETEGRDVRASEMYYIVFRKCITLFWRCETGIKNRTPPALAPSKFANQLSC
jgi:hypothetical protein